MWSFHGSRAELKHHRLWTRGMDMGVIVRDSSPHTCSPRSTHPIDPFLCSDDVLAPYGVKMMWGIKSSLMGKRTFLLCQCLPTKHSELTRQ
jgi:hypothetical protein